MYSWSIIDIKLLIWKTYLSLFKQELTCTVILARQRFSPTKWVSFYMRSHLRFGYHISSFFQYWMLVTYRVMCLTWLSVFVLPNLYHISVGPTFSLFCFLTDLPSSLGIFPEIFHLSTISWTTFSRSSSCWHTMCVKNCRIHW